MDAEKGFQRLLREETGASSVEYAVLIALILLVIIAVVIIYGQEITDLFSDVGTTVEPYTSGGGS